MNNFRNGFLTLSKIKCLFNETFILLPFSYPPDGMSALKVGLWLFALIFSIVFGKVAIHYWFFCKKLKLKIFTREGQGSWIVIFLFTCCVLFFQSTVYNAFLTLAGECCTLRELISTGTYFRLFSAKPFFSKIFKKFLRKRNRFVQNRAKPRKS